MKDIAEQFLIDGYIIFDIENLTLLNDIKSYLAENTDLSDIHKDISCDEVNKYRLEKIKRLNSIEGLNFKLYSLAQNHLHEIVGNELAHQKRANLSIQMPGDSSSLLPIHNDVWAGNSPFEVALWIPLVDCYRTKSMYILNRTRSQNIYDNFNSYKNLSNFELYEEIKNDITFLNVPYGKAVIFSHSLLHGNITNEENETRWSINYRFKSLFSPYGTKEMGEYFLPLNMKPATQIGRSFVKL